MSGNLWGMELVNPAGSFLAISGRFENGIKVETNTSRSQGTKDVLFVALKDAISFASQF